MAKIQQKSEKITAFGGIFFVLDKFDSILSSVIDSHLGLRSTLTSQMVPDNPAKKDSIVDVRCKDQRGRHFIVEMQMHWNEEFKQRVILNASKAVVKQLEKGESYTLLQPVYSLNLVNEATRKALSIVEKSAMTQSQLDDYDRFWDAVFYHQVLIDGSYKKGREEGRAEERMSNATSLLANGIPLDMIVKSLNLTPDEARLLSQKENTSL